MVTQIQTPAGSPVSVGAGSMAMTKMAVPKCQLFARILCLALSSLAGAVKAVKSPFM